MLPIAEACWPLDLLQSWNGEPALLWLSRGMNIPSLCWLRLTEHDDGYQLHVRSVMNMDESTYFLDASGKVTRTLSLTSEGQPLGGAPLTMTSVTREEVLKLEPALESEMTP